MPLVLYALASLAYLAAWFSSSRRMQSAAAATEPPARGTASSAWGAQLSLLVAIALHAVALLLPIIDQSAPVRFGFAAALSLALWLAVVLLWFENLATRLDALRLLLLPLALVGLWLPVFFPGQDISALTVRPYFKSHLAVAIAAYSVLTVAALHAGLMALAERKLHAGATAAPWLQRWLDSLPPLLVLERMLFRLIFLGFVLLTLTVGSGVLFGEEIFGRPLRWDHKTIFSLVAWIVFAVLLIGRGLRGWRGRVALRMTLTGFALLLLAYVGTRFVLEVILHRYG